MGEIVSPSGTEATLLNPLSFFLLFCEPTPIAWARGVYTTNLFSTAGFILKAAGAIIGLKKA